MYVTILVRKDFRNGRKEAEPEERCGRAGLVWHWLGGTGWPGAAEGHSERDLACQIARNQWSPSQPPHVSIRRGLHIFVVAERRISSTHSSFVRV